MRKSILVLLLGVVLTSCGAKKQPAILGTSTNPTSTSGSYEPFIDITEYSPNDKYGLVADFPIRVGEKSVANQRRYIASLAGPNGEELTFHRRGSCFPYDTENGYNGTGFLDVYEVMYEGLKEPILLYITFYEYEPLYIPKGFTRRNL